MILFVGLSIQTQVPFDSYFKVSPLLAYHRVMTMERFMEHLAPQIWPAEQRTCKTLEST